MESSFLQDIDNLFDVYCVDEQQRRQMEVRHCLRMATEDYAFYEDQRTEGKRWCVDDVVPLTSSNLRFSRHAQPLSRPTSTHTSSSSEQHSSFISDSNSDTNSSALQSSGEAIFAGLRTRNTFNRVQVRVRVHKKLQVRVRVRVL